MKNNGFSDSLNIHLKHPNKEAKHKANTVDNLQHPHLLPDKVPQLHPAFPAGRSAPPSPHWGFSGCQPASTHLSPHCWCPSQNSETHKLTVNRLEQITPHHFSLIMQDTCVSTLMPSAYYSAGPQLSPKGSKYMSASFITSCVRRRRDLLACSFQVWILFATRNYTNKLQLQLES